MDKLEHLKQLDARATKGPWTNYEFGCDHFVANSQDDSGPMLRVGSAHKDRPHNAELIATYRTATPLLIALLEQAEGALRYVSNNHGYGICNMTNSKMDKAIAAIQAFRDSE